MADLGYQGEAHLFRLPVKKPKGGELTEDQHAYNALQTALRCLGKRANSLLKTTFRPHPDPRMPLAHRRHHRSSTRPAPHRKQPHHMTYTPSLMVTRKGSLNCSRC